MAKWYKTGGYKNLIQEVEVVKETNKFVTVLQEKFTLSDRPVEYIERRSAKRSSYDNYFKTYHEAYEFLKDRRIRAKEAAEHRLASCIEDLQFLITNYNPDK